MNIDFLKARAEIQARVARLRKELDEADSELQAFDRVETIIRRHSAKSQPKKAVPNLSLVAQPKPTTNGSTHHETEAEPSKGFLTRQVLDLIAKAEAPLPAAEVTRRLLGAGYVPQGKHFKISIVKALNRLSRRDVIARTTQKDKATGKGKVKFWHK